MSKKNADLVIPNEVVMNNIYLIRGQKVMLDKGLAELYQVETKRLKEQVKRNMERFPKHFMFELSEKEHESLRSQFATSKERLSQIVITSKMLQFIAINNKMASYFCF
jgi:hypothetical protein